MLGKSIKLRHIRLSLPGQWQLTVLLSRTTPGSQAYYPKLLPSQDKNDWTWSLVMQSHPICLITIPEAYVKKAEIQEQSVI